MYSLGLKSDGTIVGWGWNDSGELNVPAPNADFIAIAAGYHSLGLKSDGTIVAWGPNDYGRLYVPVPNADFIAIAAAGYQSLGLKSDGTIVAWGDNRYGELNVPAPNRVSWRWRPAIAYSLGLSSPTARSSPGDGTMSASCNVPVPESGFVQVAAALLHSLGLKSDGSIVAWGDIYNYFDLLNVPAPNAGFIAIAAGVVHSVAIRSGGLASLQCPADVDVPGYSTIRSLSLVGFRITNAGPSPSDFMYLVSAQGPATLVDKGDPTSLSGITPVLDPGASYYPPEAGLVIPEIRDYAEERVTYHVVDATNSSCTTLIVMEPPVPVLISAFNASALAGGVKLTWDIVSDEGISGFRIYRGLEKGSITEEITSAGLIPSGARSYIDASVSGGKTYQYTLSVVLADGSEMRSPIVTVKTKLLVLALDQNIPNPFNPTTTIAFTLPARSRVTLSIYDVEGRAGAHARRRKCGEGTHEYVWDGRNDQGQMTSSGAYFYSLKTGHERITKKMVLLK